VKSPFKTENTSAQTTPSQKSRGVRHLEPIVACTTLLLSRAEKGNARRLGSPARSSKDSGDLSYTLRRGGRFGKRTPRMLRRTRGNHREDGKEFGGASVGKRE